MISLIFVHIFQSTLFRNPISKELSHNPEYPRSDPVLNVRRGRVLMMKSTQVSRVVCVCKNRRMPPETISHFTLQICQNSWRIGCVIPHCKLQCGITQPIIQLFWHICTRSRLRSRGASCFDTWSGRTGPSTTIRKKNEGESSYVRHVKIQLTSTQCNRVPFTSIQPTVCRASTKSPYYFRGVHPKRRIIIVKLKPICFAYVYVIAVLQGITFSPGRNYVKPQP